MYTKVIFCANEQAEQTHELTVSQSGEIVATCLSCKRFLKFPVGMTRKEFDKLVSKHADANTGQVTQESLDKSLAELADEELPDEVK